MVRNRSSRPYLKVAALAVAAAVVAGCATGAAFRQGEQAAHGEDWDSAVEYYRKAVQDDPRNAEYRVALHRAMLNAAREHYARARALEETGALADAVREYRRAGELDPGNNDALYRAAEVERAIRDRIEASRPRAPIEDMRDVANRETAPPLLDPASAEPLSLRFVDQSVKDILDFIGNATGVNINYDQQFQDRQYSVQLDGITVAEALDQILMANQYFYKVLGPRNVIVAPDTPQKRQQYEDQVIRTFYISNTDVLELSQLLTQIIRGGQPMPVQPQIVPNEASNTITVRATPAVTAVIEQVIAANDKPRAEIIVDIEILEVNRERARDFGLDLGDYSIGAVFAPDANVGELSTAPDFGAPPLARAGDFFFSVPSAAVDFLESDAETRVVAKPQLRGQEGAALSLNLGEEIPIPTTAFTPIAAGGAAFNPLTSFEYKDVGVNVHMVPRVTFENEIILDLQVENSTLGPSLTVAGQSMPTFGNRSVETTLRLRDGESNLLAGLLREEDRRSLRGIPGLARLPIIRTLLSSNEDTIRQTDIIMLLTPRIVRTHELTQENVSPIRIGTQRNIGVTGPGPLAVSAAASEAAPPAAAGNAAAVDQAPSLAGLPSAGARIDVRLPEGELRAATGPYIVPLSISGASQVSTLTLTLRYDPGLLRVSAVQEGSFMRQGGAEVTFTQQVDQTVGRIDLVATRPGDQVGASGAGVLAAIVFEALRPGSATLAPSGLGLTPAGAPVAISFTPAAVVIR